MMHEPVHVTSLCLEHMMEFEPMTQKSGPPITMFVNKFVLLFFVCVPRHIEKLEGQIKVKFT